MKHAWYSRLLALLLTFIMIFELVPSSVWATEATSEPGAENVTTQEAEDLSVEGEVEALRTETEKHYRLSDGSYIVVDYGMPVHYAQGEGDNAAWVDIDNTLSASVAQMNAESTAVYTAVNGNEAKAFASVFMPDDYLFSSRLGEYGVSMSLMQETTANQLLAAASQASEEAIPPEDQSEAALPETTVPVESSPSDEAAAEGTAQNVDASEETVPAQDTGDPAIAAPQETGAGEETWPTPETTSLPEEEGGESPDATAPTEESPARETEAEPTEEPATEAPTEETAPVPQQEPSFMPVEETVDAQTASSVPQLQPAQAQIINPNDGVSLYTLEDESTEEISEQVELPKLSSTILYPDVLPGVDLRYDTAGQNIKESIIVNERQANYTYRFLLSLAGLTPSLQEDGSILLCSADGEAVYTVPAPYMIDAAGEVSYHVTYTLDEVENGYILTVTADRAWIEESGRALPVTIDPALLVTSGGVQDDIAANFVSQASPTKKYNGSQLYMGNQGGAGKNLNAYLYFKTLPTIPANCSVVGATVSLYKMDYSHVGMSKFYGQIRQVTGDKPSGYSNYTSWIYDINWNTAPAYSETVEDYAELYSTGSTGKYIDWDISRAVCNWYTDPTINNRTLAITPYAPTGFTSTNYACTAYYTFTNTRRPIFIVYYRNNVGLESYYTYQTVSAGRAGTGYISDYTSQLTLANTAVSSSSNALPFSITAYYNSANRNKYFVDSDSAGIHTVNYTGMRSGAGWKLSIQESIRLITVKTEDVSYEYYVYHDGDGSEHYFLKTGKSSPYEDEDGLNLTLAVSGSTFTLKDKNDNIKEFYNGYLTKIGDANGNAIYLLYNGKEYSAGATTWKPTSSSANYVSKIIRINDNGSAADVQTTLFTLSYANGFLQSITDTGGRKTSFGYSSVAGYNQLTSITFPDGKKAEYSYDGTTGALLKAYDGEAKVGVGFVYRNFKGTLCVQKVREFAASSLTGTETVGSQWHLWVYSPQMKEYRFYGPDQAQETSDDTVARYTFDHTGKTVNIVNFNTDRSQILGVSNASYTANSNTKTKNRLSGAAATGYLAKNLLNNSGFEVSNTSAYSWVTAVSEQSTQVNTGFRNNISEVSPAIKPHTGNYLLKTYLKAEKVSATACVNYAGMHQRVYLQKGVSYTFSAWANTAAITRYGKDGGMLLQFRNDSGGQILAASELLNYQTSRDINDGWTRLEVSYTPSGSGWYRVYAIQRNASAFGAFDDMQLEETKSDASESGASTANLVQLGSFELWNGTTADRSLDPTYWSYDASKATPGTDGAWEGYSMYIPGAITDKRRASQTITINKSSDSTYILSGWAQAYSAPNCTPATDMKGDNSEGKRFFGLIAKVSYTDTSLAPDYHYVTFDCNYTGWQYASGSIVPKQRGKTVSTITITTAYDYNINVGHFDDISLVEEPAQTYTYDEKGNLKATTSTGNSDENFKYNGADLIEQTAGGYGSYTYDYDKAHNMIKATNDNVSVTATYDDAGNSTGTRLQKSDKTGVYLQTSATYTANQDHTASVTDANGGTTTFGYDSLGRNTSTSTPIDTGVTSTTNYTYVSGTDRQYRTSNSAGGVLYYGYTNGVQTEASRYSKNSQMRPWQRYHLTLDAWGNTTKIQVQSGTGTTVTSWLNGPTLASYEYAGNNGYLSKMTNANGDYETYTYDRYGRIVTIEHRTKNGSLNYTEVYVYDGNGNTGRCKVIDGSGNITDDYRYEYDSLGRLIRSSQVSDGETVLRTEHIYDADNRLTKQSYQLGASSFSESYEYNNNDGSMKSMDTANGDTLSFTYDAIKRLESVAAGSRYTKTYGYRTISGSQTTTQISSLAYSGFTGAPTYRYAYTANGNIKSVQNPNGSSIAYTYDTQGQLTKAVDENWATTYNYTYDAAGNILSKSLWSDFNGSDGSLSYTYGNESWPDLLTAVNGDKIAYEGQTYNSAANTVSGTVVSGNPISYFNGNTRWSFAWENGRQLATASSSEGNTDTTIDYAYDLNGYRTSKTVVTKTYETVPVHNYVTTVVAATCTEGGYTLHECACGDSYRTDETAALGHDYIENGVDSYICTRCGDTYTAHTHRYTTSVVDPTCENDGYTLHTCVCGYSYRDNVVAKLGHSYVQVSDHGTYIVYRCTRCGTFYNSPVITIPVDPNPPISSYSLTEESNTTGCHTERVLKSTVTEEHSYIYAGGKLLRETITTTAANGSVTTKVLDFAYDAQGTPYSLTYTTGTASPVTYYYITNLQGDVTYLINSSGAKVATYEYDPYGKITYITGPMAQINPLRYRGYYYDSDTEFYYLQSRYYDAAICRFINADAYTVSSREFTGYNMFAYRGNNPASRTDSSGDSWWGWVAAVAVVAVCAVAVVATAGGAAAAITAVTAVANGCAATTAASTVAAGAFVGASTALAGTAVMAACESESLDDFASFGETAALSTAFGGAFGAMEASTYNPGNCFIAGTLVMAQDGNIPIEEVAAGDYVWAWDEETGDVALKQVVETYVNETEELIHLSVNGEEITCTPGHPFYSPVKGWTEAVHLRAGDVLVLVNGEYVVVEWVQHELLESPVKVYNFQVTDYHTYYVTRCGILVHNMCDKNEPRSEELSDTELRNFGEPGKNKGIRQTNGSADEAMNFFNSQTVPETRTVQPNGYAVSGTNSRGVQFTIYNKPNEGLTSIFIAGVKGLRKIKFLWQ